MKIAHNDRTIACNVFVWHGCRLPVNHTNRLPANKKMSRLLDYGLTDLDKNLVKSMKTICEMGELETFTSDTMRSCLDPLLKRRNVNVGAHFARAKRNGCYVWTKKITRSERARNNLRHIKVWRLADNIDEIIVAWNTEK